MIALPPVALASALLAPAARATATTDPSPSTDPTSSPTTDVTQTVEAAKETAVNVWEITWRVGGGLLIGVALAFIGVVVLRMLGRRQTMYAEISRYTRTALYAMGGLFGAYLGAQLAVVAVATPDWAQYALQTLRICIILTIAWVIVGLVKALEASIVSGVRSSGDPGTVAADAAKADTPPATARSANNATPPRPTSSSSDQKKYVGPSTAMLPGATILKSPPTQLYAVNPMAVRTVSIASPVCAG